MFSIDVNSFINNFITKRSESLFSCDLKDNFNTLEKSIRNKSVLVIGGAGTIGKSFIKQLLYFKPSKLVVVDTNENELTELTRDLRSEYNQYVPKIYLPYPMDFGDKLFKKILNSHGPFNIIANFAAFKHVRTEKDVFSIESMVNNNIFKASFLMNLLLDNKPEHFFCVSTDKASSPINVMGASKKLMEELIMSYSSEIKVTTARFANVAFSNGSLLAGYLKRFSSKQPISCPSNIKRFFVSPEESGQICLLACILGESGDIFFPNLNENNLISFKEITEQLFRSIDVEIKICNSESEAKMEAKKIKSSKDAYPVYFFNSNTTGEKIYENFYSKFDLVDNSRFKSLGVIKNTKQVSVDEFELNINNLKRIFKNVEEKSSIIESLKNILDDFNHKEKGKNLDQQM